jgi:Domain of unknown function (DUF4133)
MQEKQYLINKGINRPIEFKGVKAQYIGYLAAAAAGMLVIFGIMYSAGISQYICAPSALALGGYATARIMRLSSKYGQFGLMKLQAKKRIPAALLSKSRKVFIQMHNHDVSKVR